MLHDFKRLMSARFLFTLGVQMQAVIIGWQVYRLTHDPLALGLIGLAEAVPALSLALYAGYIVDRSRPLQIYRWVLRGSLLSGLVLLGSQWMGETDVRRQIIALFISSVITGMARGFSQPAMFATVPRLIPREKLHQASAWMSSVMQVARISGPALGGLVFGYFGIITAASLICVSLLLAIACVSLIQADPLPTLAHAKADLFSGVRFVFKHPVLLPALSLDMISVLFGGVTALLPIFAAEILFVGPRGLGLLRAAPAVGAALMSFALTRKSIQKNAGAWLLTAVSGFGICILIFGLSRSFLLSFVALGLSGVFDSISMVIRGAAVQLASPDGMRGRISAVNSIFIGSSNELGEFESGVAARFFGTVPAVMMGGVICLMTVCGLAFLFPKLRTLDLRTLQAAPMP